MAAEAEQSAHASEPANSLWPGPDYCRQVERLRQAVGQTVFIAEFTLTPTQLSARVTDTAYELLAVLDFPRPNPSRGLTPHLILLDDGRGLNLGRIARVSIGAPFAPSEQLLLYQDSRANQQLLFGERQLSPQRIENRSRVTLAHVLGHPDPLAE